MNMREKFAEARKMRTVGLSADQAKVNSMLQSFLRDIPSMMQSAMDKMHSGAPVPANFDGIFERTRELPGDVWRGKRDAQTNLDDFTMLPALKQLKLYLSDPAVDISFSFTIDAAAGDGWYNETVRLSINPDKPFSDSQITYRSGDDHAHMAGAGDRNIPLVARASKPKLAVPGSLAA